MADARGSKRRSSTLAGTAHNYGATPELSVVIPTLDPLSERVRRCVGAIRTHTDVDYEIVLVGNDAPPQGFTAPVNSGIRAAAGAYVVVMNDDVEVMAGWWPPLREVLEQGAYVSFPVTHDGFHRADFTGWCFAISRQAIAAVGHSPQEFLDPQFRVWFQDTDLLLRLCQAGRPPVVADGSRIRHDLSQTLDDRTDEQFASWIEEQIKRDRKAFMRKWPGGRRGPLARELLSQVPDPTAGVQAP
jgi:GT2 family glycosyltransferase